MTVEELSKREFEKEIVFSYSRSSGPGGQNVNKVNTRVELRINLATSQSLSLNELEQVQKKLKNKINTNGELILVSQSERSQIQNKENVILKFYLLLSKALTPQKKRRPTAPTKASKEKRLDSKRIIAEKKIRRRNNI